MTNRTEKLRHSVVSNAGGPLFSCLDSSRTGSTRHTYRGSLFQGPKSKFWAERSQLTQGSLGPFKVPPKPKRYSDATEHKTNQFRSSKNVVMNSRNIPGIIRGAMVAPTLRFPTVHFSKLRASSSQTLTSVKKWTNTYESTKLKKSLWQREVTNDQQKRWRWWSRNVASYRSIDRQLWKRRRVSHPCLRAKEPVWHV